MQVARALLSFADRRERSADEPVYRTDTPRGRPVSYVLVALLTLAGLAYSLLLGSGTRFPDERDYLALAASLAHEGTYSYDGRTPNAMRTPGYPVLLAPVAATARAIAPAVRPGDAGAPEATEGALDASGTLPLASVASPAEVAVTVHLARTLQFLAVGLSTLALASLAGVGARDRAGLPLASTEGLPRDALGAAMLVGLAGYPVVVYTAGTLFPQTAVLALAALVLWLLERARPDGRRALLIGLLCGATVEVTPTALTIVPMALLHVALSSRWRARHVVVVALAACLLPGAWLARNQIVLDETILFSRNLAYNLDNAVLELDPLVISETERSPRSSLGHGIERLEQLVGSPGAYLERLRRHFAWRNDMQVAAESSRARDLVMLVSYATLLGLVALRLALARRAPLSPAERSVLLLYAMTAAFHALVFVRIRYRVPFDFLLLLPAANAVLVGVAAARSSRRGDGPAGPGAGRRHSEPRTTAP